MALLGKEVVKRRLRLIQRNVGDAVAEGMDELAADILSLSNDFAPQLTGEMIRTSGTDSDDTGADRFRRSVFYTVPYAIWQHEEVFNAGPITASKPNAGRKFLTRAFNQLVGKGIRNVGREIERTLRITLR